jgi:hypothetical protein
VVFGIKDALLLREENAVLEIGVMKNSGPPIPLQALFRDRVIGGTTSERSPPRDGEQCRAVCRLEQAPGHCWLRQLVREVCRE